MPLDLSSTLLGASAALLLSALITRQSTRQRDRATPLDDLSNIYNPPRWIPPQLPAPTHRLTLGHLPTPIHRWKIQPSSPSPSPSPASLPHQIQFYIKRDDYSGSEMSGNKVRKLEFLLAEALQQSCDSAITVGGIQSNHCRATAAACARIGLDSHLVLRTSDATTDPGFVGNLLISRLCGANLHLVSPEEYQEKGGWPLVQALQKKLQATGKRPFAFPSGGSCSVGVWGYIHAVKELVDYPLHFDRIYFACGSGGTAAGLALGMHLSGMSKNTELVAVGVDDDPDFFYNKIDKLLSSLTNGCDVLKGKTSRDLLRIIDGVGAGYASSTTEELAEILNISQTTGVVLDPVYSGKAALQMLKDVNSLTTKGQTNQECRVLFIHTGGLLGFYDKVEQMSKAMKQ
jgi:D-cysteine desulfhydrase